LTKQIHLFLSEQFLRLGQEKQLNRRANC